MLIKLGADPSIKDRTILNVREVSLSALPNSLGLGWDRPE